jgi:hypothetical protein
MSSEKSQQISRKKTFPHRDGNSVSFSLSEVNDIENSLDAGAARLQTKQTPDDGETQNAENYVQWIANKTESTGDHNVNAGYTVDQSAYGDRVELGSELGVWPRTGSDIDGDAANPGGTTDGLFQEYFCFECTEDFLAEEFQ